MADDSIDGKCADGNDMQMSPEFALVVCRAAANYVKNTSGAIPVDPRSLPVMPWYRQDNYFSDGRFRW